MPKLKEVMGNYNNDLQELDTVNDLLYLMEHNEFIQRLQEVNEVAYSHYRNSLAELQKRRRELTEKIERTGELEVNDTLV